MPFAPAQARAGRASSTRPHYELADIFRRYGDAYRQAHPLPCCHLQVMHAIEVCRTSYLGGHIEQCDACGYQRPAYNSCRNRHCPKCQSLAKAQWLAARQAELLPVGYFHNVFTLPHQLNRLAQCNGKLIYHILFQAVARTLQEFAADPKHGLGGQLGFLAVLHTWDQKLLDHIHLHCLIAGGALSFDHKRWTHCRENFLFPIKALSQVFQGKFLDLLQKAFADGKLTFPGRAAPLGTPQGFRHLINQLWKKPWVVYSKKPFAGPEKVLDYLGRYTHRVAISNHRIRGVENQTVTFQYRDRKEAGKRKQITLSAEEFIRRFLLHVLPPSFRRIRHFGFLANRSKQQSLPRCRQLLGVSEAAPEPDQLDARELLLDLTGLDIAKCPSCKSGTMFVIRRLPSPSSNDRRWTTIKPEILDSS